MRTQQEILDRINIAKERDWLGTEISDLVMFLDYENAKLFLKDGITSEEWEATISKVPFPSDQIKSYLPFAWDKANNCRGISAGRSLSHMMAWLWLDGNDDLAKECEDYDMYGKRQLVKISEAYGVDWRQLDNDRWSNNESGDGMTADEALSTY